MENETNTSQPATPVEVPVIAPVPPVDVPKVSNGNKKPGKALLVFILVNVFGVATLGFIGYAISPKSVGVSNAPKVLYSREVAPEDKNSTLPSSMRYLTDTTFTNWSGTVKGSFLNEQQGQFSIAPISETRLKDGTISIEKIPNVNPIIIKIGSEPPSFFYIASNHPLNQPIPSIAYNSIIPGSIVRGTVMVNYVNNNIELVGKSFSITQQ
ncbi:MAG: hypothetical protein ACHQT7_00125 [Candidatus Levyibacteriota bacterium]